MDALLAGGGGGDYDEKKKEKRVRGDLDLDRSAAEMQREQIDRALARVQAGGAEMFDSR